MVEKGDLFYNRNVNFLMRIMGKILLFFLKDGLKKDERFKPDIHVKEGFDLVKFGFEVKVVYLPGHSKG